MFHQGFLSRKTHYKDVKTKHPCFVPSSTDTSNKVIVLPFDLCRHALSAPGDIRNVTTKYSEHLSVSNFWIRSPAIRLDAYDTENNITQKTY